MQKSSTVLVLHPSLWASVENGPDSTLLFLTTFYLCTHRTEICAFSEYRIYPGHGVKYIRRDGQPVALGTAKCRRLLVLEKKKASKLMWTQAWRRLNKKGKDEGLVRKR